MLTLVKIFKKRSAEFGEPSKLLFVVKLTNPALSLGIRKKIIKINKKLIKAPINFSIYSIYFKNVILLFIE